MKRLAAGVSALAVAAGGITAGLLLTQSSAWTFQSACASAQPGDTVNVPAGTHTSLNIGCSGTSAAHITFQPAPGASVLLDGVMNVTGSHLTIRGFTWCCQTDNAKDQFEQWQALDGSSDLLFQDDDNSGFQIFGAKDVTVQGGDYGPCTRDSEPTCEPRVFGSIGSTRYPALNTRIDGVTFHGQHSSNVNGDCGNPSDKCHVAGFVVFGGDGVTITRSRFYDNQINNFFAQNCCGNGGPSNITLENNWFGPVSGPGDGNLALSSCSGSPCSNLHIRFNSITEQPIFAAAAAYPGSFQYVGNIVAMNDAFFCPPSVGLVDRNVFVPGNARCGTNSGGASNPWVSLSPLNLHLRAGSVGAVPSGCPAVDFDGQPRTAPCDAGASNAATGPPPPPVGMNVRELSRTASTITVGWTPQPGTVGYLFLRAGVRVSSTFDATKASIKFSLVPGAVYTVRALSKLDEGSVTG